MIVDEAREPGGGGEHGGQGLRAHFSGPAHSSLDWRGTEETPQSVDGPRAESKKRNTSNNEKNKSNISIVITNININSRPAPAGRPADGSGLGLRRGEPGRTIIILALYSNIVLPYYDHCNTNSKKYIYIYIYCLRLRRGEPGGAPSIRTRVFCFTSGCIHYLQ